MDLRRDPLSGRLVAIAPGRRTRPTGEPLAECPFCAGNEHLTPPETLRVDDGAGGWTVRVVPNLYPAFERQEVVVHSPRHVESFAELDDAEVDAVAQAWEARRAAAREEGFAYLHALVNEGAAAGASRAHSHSQLVWLREEPPAVAAERSPDCALCTLLTRPNNALLLGEREGIVSLVHPAGRLPYETLIAAAAHAPLALAPALTALRDVVRRLRAVEGPVPWNAWLHDGDHPHVELVPRLAILAGVELGAGIYVNTVDPEDAAAALRAV